MPMYHVAVSVASTDCTNYAELHCFSKLSLH